MNADGTHPNMHLPYTFSSAEEVKISLDAN